MGREGAAIRRRLSQRVANAFGHISQKHCGVVQRRRHNKVRFSIELYSFIRFNLIFIIFIINFKLKLLVGERWPLQSNREALGRREGQDAEFWN